MQVWTWLVGFFVTFTGGILTYRAYSDARAFAGLARRLRRRADGGVAFPFPRLGRRFG